MNTHTTILSGLLLFVLVMGMLVYTFLVRSTIVDAPSVVQDDMGSGTTATTSMDTAPDTPVGSMPDTTVGEISDEMPTPSSAEAGNITASATYQNGEHTLRGNITLPTPCHTLTVDAIVMESMPEQVLIRFVTEASLAMCAQVMTDRPFTVVVSASEAAQFSATLDGERVPLTLLSGGSL